MEAFFRVKTVDQVLELIDEFPGLPAEIIDLPGAGQRILAEYITAHENIPDFDRTCMDGFAVRSKDTFGASEGFPALFTIKGEIHMGVQPEFDVQAGEAVRIWTGGMMPRGADAVVMLEYARHVDQTTVELTRPAAPFDHVIRRGEDVRAGQSLLQAGRKLRPQDLGLLAALGVSEVGVVKRPRVALLSTGDEIIPISETPGPGQMRDVNTYTLQAMIHEYGGVPIILGLVGDRPDDLKNAVVEGLAEADVVVLSGGSSGGIRDYTVEIFQSFPDSEILVHGVSVSPGKPTVMARVGHQSLWGLPGHTVSAMITCRLFIRPLVARLGGALPDASWGKTVKAVLTRNVPSVHGRQDYVRVRLESNSRGIEAHPILGKSGLISTMVRADGLLMIGLHEEGVLKGSEVDVMLFNT
jgi:molybdopterin molybdotransferase